MDIMSMDRASMDSSHGDLVHGNFPWQFRHSKNIDVIFTMDTWSMADLHGNPYHRSHVHDEMRYIYMSLCRIGDLVIDLRLNMKHN